MDKQWSYNKHERWRKFKLFAQKLLKNKGLVDLLGYLIFWTAPNYIVNILFVGVRMDQWLAVSFIGFVITIFLAPPFGRWMDFFRRYFGVK